MNRCRAALPTCSVTPRCSYAIGSSHGQSLASRPVRTTTLSALLACEGSAAAEGSGQSLLWQEALSTAVLAGWRGRVARTKRIEELAQAAAAVREAELRSELRTLRPRALQKRAEAVGVEETALDGAVRHNAQSRLMALSFRRLEASLLGTLLSSLIKAPIEN